MKRLNNSISFCTTCKGRLWQLKKTIHKNMNIVNKTENCELILLNYDSQDGLNEYIQMYFSAELASGKLKFYQIKEKRDFDMSLAKNVSHLLAQNTVLFNLDADNFIDSHIISELRTLPENSILTSDVKESKDKGRYGRIGIHKTDFEKLRGYDEEILGMGSDDIDLMERAFNLGFKNRISRSYVSTIPNTESQKVLYSSQEQTETFKKQKTITKKEGVNPIHFGNLEVERILVKS